MTSLTAWPCKGAHTLLNCARLLAAGVTMALLGACSGGANQRSKSTRLNSSHRL